MSTNYTIADVRAVIEHAQEHMKESPYQDLALTQYLNANLQAALDDTQMVERYDLETPRNFLNRYIGNEQASIDAAELALLQVNLPVVTTMQPYLLEMDNNQFIYPLRMTAELAGLRFNVAVPRELTASMSAETPNQEVTNGNGETVEAIVSEVAASEETTDEASEHCSSITNADAPRRRLKPAADKDRLGAVIQDNRPYC